MPQADPAVQQLLLDLADVDQAADAARSRRATLPELAIIADAGTRCEKLEGELVLARAEIGDLDLAARKLDDEIDAVRAREKRDADLLASGTAPAKELENLQREMESLARRQSTLEDDALELMEKREEADAAIAKLQADADASGSELARATAVRDEQFAAIDAELAELDSRRQGLVPGIPAEVLAVYDRLRNAGKVAAAPLRGDRCMACQIALDRVSVEEIRSAPVTALQRCPECSAILVRGEA